MIRLTPLAGVWELDSVYQVKFLNSSQSTIQAQAASAYQDGSTISILSSDGKTTVFEIDLGVVGTVPANNSGAALISDGQVIVIDDGARRLTFEFDSNNSVASGNLPVLFTSTSTPS
ncbi:MAG: hypothetical protein ACK55I_36380, partial [bacterium]